MPLIGSLELNVAHWDFEAPLNYQHFVVMHQLTHVFAFDLDADKLAKWADSSTEVFHGEANILADETARGYNSKIITTPKVVIESQAHFDWNTLTGLQLEGDSTSYENHWDMRVARDEYMTADLSTRSPTYSKLTWALFEDTGWYSVNYDWAQPLLWGKDAGWTFLSDTWSSDAVDYCSRTDLAQEWTYNALQVGVCNLQTYTNDLPTEFQYFVDTKKGGGNIYLDYCPVVEAYSNRDCRTTQEQQAHTELGEVYGANSRWVQSSLSKIGEPEILAGLCVEVMECLVDRVRLRLAANSHAGEVTFECLFTGGTVNIQPDYDGSITCPASTILCQEMPCINQCRGVGQCINSLCVWQDGYGGDDCSIVCHSSCRRCTANTESAWTLCYTNYTLDGNQCLVQRACSGGKVQVGEAWECPDYKYEVDDVCFDCAINCRTCTGPATTECTACSDNYVVSGGECICADGYYANGVSTCSPCDISWYSCTGPDVGEWTRCRSDSLLNISTWHWKSCDWPTGVTARNSSGNWECPDSVWQCPLGQWFNSNLYQWEDCDHSCTACSSTNTCTSCTWPRAVSGSSWVCAEDLILIGEAWWCQGDLVDVGSDCICPVGSRTYKDGISWLDCPSGCDSCTSITSCTTCLEGYTLRDSLWELKDDDDDTDSDGGSGDDGFECDMNCIAIFFIVPITSLAIAAGLIIAAVFVYKRKQKGKIAMVTPDPTIVESSFLEVVPQTEVSIGTADITLNEFKEESPTPNIPIALPVFNSSNHLPYNPSKEFSIDNTKQMSQKAGPLFKLGEGPFNFGWNRRFAKLENESLYYYKSSTEKHHKAVLDIREAGVSQIYDNHGKDWTFTLQLTNKQLIHLALDTEQEAREWREAILAYACPDMAMEPYLDEDAGKDDQEIRQHTEIPSHITQQMQRLRRAVDSTQKWTTWAYKSDTKVQVYAYQPFEVDKDGLKEACTPIFGCIIALFVLSYLVYFPFVLDLLIIGLVSYKFLSKSHIMTKRFEKIKSSCIIDEDAKEIFSILMDPNNSKLWDWMVESSYIKENVDEHTDNMTTVFKPPIEKWYMPFTQLSFEFTRYWMMDPDRSYFILMKATSDGAIGGYEGIVIKPLDTSSIVTWVSELEFPNIPVILQEQLLLTRVKGLMGLKDTLLQQSLEDQADEAKRQETIQLFESESDHVMYSNCVRVSLEDRLYTDYVRNPTGGILCKNKADLNSQKGVILELLKKAGKQLIAGKHVVGVSLPVRIFEARSTLERMVDWWCTAPVYLVQAARESDSIARMKNLICFVVSGLYYGTRQLKPFNPILGETYQGQFHDGTEIFIEHTSHHPPIANFLVQGPESLYTYKGYYEFTAAVKGNSVIGKQKGPNVVSFADGGVVEFSRPSCRISGTMYGKRILEYMDSMEFLDRQNGLVCKIEFAGKGGLFSKAKHPSDFFIGSITQNDQKIVDIRGSYLESLEFDGDVFWELEKSPIYKGIQEFNPLPSDCRYREDMIYLGRGLQQMAEDHKIRLEVLQRSDRTLRANHNKKKS